jgi:uncharacterized protein YaeQ
MALKATVCKAQLQVSDMDRGYYAGHALTLAQHPSETVERLMSRLLAFALFAEERLQFGRGVSSEDEPDLWQQSLDGRIEHWIELGQPEESRIRRACGRSPRVTVLGYAPRSFDPWWDKHGAALSTLRPLQVLCLPPGATDSLAALHARSMDLQCLVQDGVVQLIDAQQTLEITPRWLQRRE